MAETDEHPWQIFISYIHLMLWRKLCDIDLQIIQGKVCGDIRISGTDIQPVEMRRYAIS